MKVFKSIGAVLGNIGSTFVNGDGKTNLSYLIFGLGPLLRGQTVTGLAYLACEVLFILYMVFFGGKYISKFSTLGTVETTKVRRVTTYGDNSFLILLFSLLTIILILLFVAVWYINICENKKEEELLAKGKALPTNKQVLGSFLDANFDKTLLTIPVLGIFVFTVLPILFMICIAFTNYDKTHTPPSKLFTWVGLSNFKELFGIGGGSEFSSTFLQVLLWTLAWAFFATFLDYFLGMAVAILINKKGIKFKKLWRTILVVTIAVPQFVSLLYVMKMLIGIPYMMLIATGLLMNIPEELYESARIDGASPFQMFKSITLPYMLFVTGPFLLTQFTGNLNNFNVIYLLTQGKPQSMALSNNAGRTDLLVTWLYKMTINDSNYKMAAVIGIMVFIVTAVISLVVYNMLPSVKDEGGFQ